jgi:hypothetical protein
MERSTVAAWWGWYGALDVAKYDDVLDQAEGEEAPGTLQTPTGKLAPST